MKQLVLSWGVRGDLLVECVSSRQGREAMAMKINGIDGTFPVPNILRRAYLYAKFDATLKATVGAILKTVTVKTALESAWTGVVQRSNTKPCNECFRQLFRKKTLTEILLPKGISCCISSSRSRDIPTPICPRGTPRGATSASIPGCFSIRTLWPSTCTLIHELAHVGGASTDAGAAPDIAHAAEKTLLSCGCSAQYRSGVLSTIKLMRSGGSGGPRYA